VVILERMGGCTPRESLLELPDDTCPDGHGTAADVDTENISGWERSDPLTWIGIIGTYPAHAAAANI